MSLTTDVIDPRARAVKLLDALGSIEEEVAAKLIELDIKGTPRSGEDDPIANYLFKNDVFHLGVDRETVTLPNGHVDVPTAVAEFIEGFDCREYPELIKPVVS